MPSGRPARASSLNLLIALLAGIVVGVGLAFALEQIDEAIADPTEVEQRARHPAARHRSQGPTGRCRSRSCRIRKSTLIEAYLSIQTSLAFSTDHGVPRSLAVTSTRPAEGKIDDRLRARPVARAARAAACVLVDGDMRSPSVHTMLGIDNERGLSNYLAGSDDLSTPDQADRHDRPVRVLTAGPQPPNAAELLSSDRLEHLLERAAGARSTMSSSIRRR